MTPPTPYLADPDVTLWHGDALDVLRGMDADSVDCVVCSPPYWSLRDYNVEGQLGLEETPEQYVASLVAVFREVRRVLCPHGTCWVNLGDSYASSPPGNVRGVGETSGLHGAATSEKYRETLMAGHAKKRNTVVGDLKQKDLVGVPWMVAFALRADGWWLRSDIVWAKPNPMPESVTDRPTKSHEYVFLLTKQPRYWFDQEAVREPAEWARWGDQTVVKEQQGTASWIKPKPKEAFTGGRDARQYDGEQFKTTDERNSRFQGPSPADGGRNVRTVWTIATQPYPEAHFACVDDETQALTTQGWRYHHELEDGDAIGAYDPKTGTVRFLRSTFHRYPYDGELVAIEKRDTSQRLTPNHRCVARPRDGDEMVVLAEELMPRMDVRLAAPLECGYFGRPLGDYAALVGWYIAEGWRRSDGKAIYLSQSESANPRSVGLIRELLLSVNADFTERRRERQHLAVTSVEIEWAVYGEVAARLRVLAPGKRMTSSLALLGGGDAERLLHALVAGDGHVRSDGRIVIIQKDRESIEFMQMLAMRCGYRAHLSQRADGIYTLYLTRGEWLTLRSTNGAHVPIPREHYVGTVWCPNTPTGFWLARRDGKPFITGNTYPEELVRRCVLAGCPERVCRTCGKAAERLVENTYSKTSANPNSHSGGAGPVHRPMPGGEESRLPKLFKTVETLGWSDCGHNDWRPGVVLDPFVGSGTTCLVARNHGRHSVGIDLNADYLRLAATRLQQLSLLTAEAHASQ